MRSQLTKDLYYLSFGKLSYASLLWNRWRPGSRFKDAYVNIGCGPKYVRGMVNIDGNIFRKKDLWLDVTLGLPFPDSSVRGIYASHVIEHFDIKRLRRVLAEFHRVLQPGGAVRIVVPSLDHAIRAYVAGDGASFPDWPERFDSIGGRFNNFLLCANQHFLMFDFAFLQELLQEAGFRQVCPEGPQSSRHFRPEHTLFESDPALKDRSIYAEAIK